MNYEETLAYLTNLTKFGINLGLERITELLRRLGNPHLAGESPAFVHIGGTNGKGSTAVMVARVLQAAGHRVGLFTSPHLHCYTERTRINGQPIPKEAVTELVGQMKPALEAMVAEGFEHPTEFEVWTALSLLYFYREQVDLAVLEVGLGGAIDSTNVVTPVVAAITNVSLDHLDYLGNTVAEIARVKAGIIKSGVPVVTASDDPVVLAELATVADRLQAPLIRVVPEVGGADPVTVSWTVANSSGLIDVQGRTGNYGWLQPPLAGAHQQVNLATAVAVLEVIREQGFPWETDQLKKGLVATVWPARQEWLGNVLLDGAHNVAGALSLAKTLREQYAGWRKVLVLGMLGDKEREAVVRILAPLAEHVIVTRPNSPRAGNWTALAAIVAAAGLAVTEIEDIGEAVATACSLADHWQAQTEKVMVVVTGSLYMVADARKWLLARETL
ncbi:MAG: bifunctional folylpolyglutamate synthase/dihydrofolate synthase [Heliobacteriaceae bacterium]|nr:bifunctional folylpolyglutamate synthase/dihydrofolate synthase [Heliobacteriaceae bacterium]